MTVTTAMTASNEFFHRGGNQPFRSHFFFFLEAEAARATSVITAGWVRYQRNPERKTKKENNETQWKKSFPILSCLLHENDRNPPASFLVHELKKSSKKNQSLRPATLTRWTFPRRPASPVSSKVKYELKPAQPPVVALKSVNLKTPQWCFKIHLH